MFKKRFIAVVAGLALLAAVTGTGLVADGLGVNITPAAHACTPTGTGGGGC